MPIPVHLDRMLIGSSQDTLDSFMVCHICHVMIPYQPPLDIPSWDAFMRQHAHVGTNDADT